MNNAEDRIDLRRVAQMALAEDECATPIEECRSKNGPANCRVHCVSYLDRLCDTLTFEDAVKGLKAKFNVDCVRLEDLSTVAKDSLLLEEVNKRVHGTTSEDFRSACKSLYVCMSDLKSRFPTIQFPKAGLCIGAVPDSENDLSLSSVDSTFGGIAMMVLSMSGLKGEYLGYHYGHDDARLKYDILRHEIGHWLSDGDKINRFRRMISFLMQRNPNDAVLQQIDNNISDYAAEAFRRHDDKEVLAEMFAKFTSPDYRRGAMDAVLEIFVENQIITSRG